MIVELLVGLIPGVVLIMLILLTAWSEPPEAPTLSQWEAERRIGGIKRRAITDLFDLERPTHDDDVIEGTAREVTE